MRAPAFSMSRLSIGRDELHAGFAAGLFGGLAEVGWIALHQALAGGDSGRVARGVFETVAPGLGHNALAAPMGVAVHMALSMALGLVLAVALRRFMDTASPTPKAMAVFAALIAIWAVNFFVVLPVLNPDFVTIVPYGVSLISKALFGVAAATVFFARARRRA